MLRISWLFCIFRYSPTNKVWQPKRGKFPNQDMAKVQNISEIHPTLGFTEFDILEKYRKSFNGSELGRLHSVFPFGRMAKVNNGISFIEHLSFKAFNEGIRLKDCIRMQQKLMNVRVRCVAADSIYANNANRKFCTKYGISTSFVRKGRAARDESLRKVLRSELSRERATRLEGSFGTQKQHYSLLRIKARNRKTEILWIFFGIHTANAVLMIDKIRNRTVKAA